MNKFNEIAQTVLDEAQVNPRLVAWAGLDKIYRHLSDLLSKKGLKAYEYNDVMDVVQKAIKLAFNEGYKAGSTNPFK
jgi:hypothetical protein